MHDILPKAQGHQVTPVLIYTSNAKNVQDTFIAFKIEAWNFEEMAVFRHTNGYNHRGCKKNSLHSNPIYCKVTDGRNSMTEASDRTFPSAEDMPLTRRLAALAFLAVAYIFYAWAWNTVDILRPYIASDLKLSLTEAGSLYSVQALGALIGAVINGQLADRFGRRNALMVVMVGFGSVLALGTVVTSYPQILSQRFVLGYFTGSMYPITVGIYAGLFSTEVRGRVASVIMGSSYLAVSLLGAATALIFKLQLDWHLLLWAGAVPVVLAFVAPFAVPNDRKMIPFGGVVATSTVKGKLPISELFSPRFRRQTIMLTIVTGLNFFAYQAFSGWATTYLKTVRMFSDSAIGVSVSWMFAGSVIGGFFWGWIGDRFGRRAPAVGFFLAAALILVYLYAPISPGVLNIVAFGYGACLACSVVWGPWLSELYPSHLKSTAASIFNWGRIFSMFAPLLTGQIAEHFGLATTMTLGSIVFSIAAMIWLSLPETLKRKTEPAVTAPAPAP
jgi:MFS family permease